MSPGLMEKSVVNTEQRSMHEWVRWTARVNAVKDTVKIKLMFLGRVGEENSTTRWAVS